MNETRPPLREVIARHGLTASKALGQNFLLDAQLLDRIARVPGDLRDADVFEVGPGPGGLTRALIDAGARVVAVERDRRCMAALAELGAAHPDKLRLVEDDALDIDLPSVLPLNGHIVANLPYNIGTALFVRWMAGEDWPPRWASLTLMFQAEVAERIVAAPDTEHYGRLSILAQWRSTPRIAMRVHRSAFTPPPRVMSAVVHVVPISEPTGVKASTLERLTAAAFGQRRKMLRASLKGVPQALDALASVGIDSARRAETLSVEEFVALARTLDAGRAEVGQFGAETGVDPA